MKVTPESQFTEKAKAVLQQASKKLPIVEIASEDALKILKAAGYEVSIFEGELRRGLFVRSGQWTDGREKLGYGSIYDDFILVVKDGQEIAIAEPRERKKLYYSLVDISRGKEAQYKVCEMTPPANNISDGVLMTEVIRDLALGVGAKQIKVVLSEKLCLIQDIRASGLNIGDYLFDSSCSKWITEREWKKIKKETEKNL